MRQRDVCMTCAFVACALMLACTSQSTSSDGMIVLRALDGASADDTMMVNATLPSMRQCGEALYHITNHTGVGHNGTICMDDVIRPEYKIIPLETSENCVIGSVDNVVKDDSLLFVVDRWNKHIFTFDLDGNFLYRIGRLGHAANEYVNMIGVSFDKDGKRLCVVDDDSQKLVFYDYQGNFLGKESCYFEYEDMAFLGKDRRVYLTLTYDNKDYKAMNACRLTVADGKGMPLCGVLPDRGYPKRELDRIQFNARVDHPLHSNPDGVYYVDILSPDTIWRVRRDGCVPFLAVDFGEPFTTSKSYQKMTGDSYIKRLNQVKCLRDDFIFTKDFGYLNFYHCDHAVLNLKTGKCQTGQIDRNPHIPYRDFHEYTYFSYPNEKIFLYDWNDNQIVKVWDAAELKRGLEMLVKNDGWKKVYDSWPQRDRNILERVTSEINPVLVVATFKEF